MDWAEEQFADPIDDIDLDDDLFEDK